ncbi:MAG: substrate-binding domain-containing protein, partial [Lachnospiraceae bacterium]
MKIQYRTMYKLIMALLALSAALLIAGYSVLRPDISANQKEGSRLIGASYMTMNNEFYEILNEQISHRVEAEGDRLILRNPALSVSRQVEQIGKMLDEGISVLILTPVDSDGLTDILKRARQQGVKIIVVDSSVSDEQLVDCTIVSDNYRAGCLLGDYLLQNKENSKVVILTHE